MGRKLLSTITLVMLLIGTMPGLNRVQAAGGVTLFTLIRACPSHPVKRLIIRLMSKQQFIHTEPYILGGRLA